MSFEVGKSFGGGRTESSGGGKREFQVSGAGSRGRLGRRFKNAEAYNDSDGARMTDGASGELTARGPWGTDAENLNSFCVLEDIGL